QHARRVVADRVYGAGCGVDGDHRRLRDQDALAAHEHERVRGAEIDRQVARTAEAVHWGKDADPASLKKPAPLLAGLTTGPVAMIACAESWEDGRDLCRILTTETQAQGRI